MSLETMLLNILRQTNYLKSLSKLDYALPIRGFVATSEANMLVLEYVELLHSYGLLYHFDDDPDDIIWGKFTPSKEVKSLMRKISSRLYGYELFGAASQIADED